MVTECSTAIVAQSPHQQYHQKKYLTSRVLEADGYETDVATTSTAKYFLSTRALVDLRVTEYVQRA